MEKFIAFIVLLIVYVGIALILAYPFMLLWNWLMPEVFGLKTITFWQGVGLQIISYWLFKPSGTPSE